MSAPFVDLPPYATALQRSGYRPELNLPPLAEVQNDATQIKYRPLSDSAVQPTYSTSDSAGLDLYSATNIQIPAGKIVAVPTDIAIELERGTYGQIQPRSGIALHDGVFSIPGVIDSDYRGNVKVLLLNTTRFPYSVETGQRICQMIVHRIPTATMTHTMDSLSQTERDTQGFGSTEKRALPAPSPTEHQNGNTLRSSPHASSDDLHVIPLDSEDDIAHEPIPTVTTASVGELLYPFSIHLSSDPYDNVMTRELMNKDTHPHRGLVLEQCPLRNLPKIVDCLPGTPAATLPKWRSTLRGSYLLTMDGVPVFNISDVRSYFVKLQDVDKIQITVGTIEKAAMHSDDGIPMLYFDQLNMIADHLRQIKYPEQNLPPESTTTILSTEKRLQAAVKTLRAILYDDNPFKTAKMSLLQTKHSKKLTRRYLKQQPEWSEWLMSEWKQLDQYEAQGTFGKPSLLPPGANCLSLLWTYVVKSDPQKTKKSRCVCDGNPRNKGSITWGHTYAKALDHVGHRIFWAAVAQKNFIVRGSDASNAFAEAPPPKHPLYVRTDSPFSEWWASKNRPPIPEGYVLPVQKALQRHPESPRLWATLIDNILTKDLELNPTTHEPCLYHGHFNGEEILFLRQVDDFLCAAEKNTRALYFPP